MLDKIIWTDTDRQFECLDGHRQVKPFRRTPLMLKTLTNMLCT